MSQPPFSPAPYTDAQRREASDWFVIIRDESDPKAESFQAWLRWMDQDEGNRAAFDAITHAWHGIPDAMTNLMPDDNELSADDYDGEQSIDEWLKSQSSVTTAPVSLIKPATNKLRRLQFTWLAAAASIVVAIAGLLAMNHYLDLRTTRSDEFTTRNGEQIEITLADGSHVWLAPKSRLLVNFDKQHRGIQLTSGEAFFSVKKDKSRPFVVQSAGGDVTAVGTAFNVRAIDDHITTVAVSEGVVAVTPKELPVAGRTPGSVHVASGQQLTFTADQPIKALTIVQSPTVGERARWRDGVLVYRDEPLQEVVSDIARHSDIKIEIADASIGNLHFSGVIYHDAVLEWISALPESFPVTVVSDGTREIIKAR